MTPNDILNRAPTVELENEYRSMTIVIWNDLSADIESDVIGSDWNDESGYYYINVKDLFTDRDHWRSL